MKLRPTRLLTLSTVFACIVSESQADEQTIMDLKPVIWLDANHAGDVDLTTAGRVKVWRDRSSNHNDAAVRGDAVPPVWPELIKNVTRGSLSAIRMHSGYLLIKRPLTSNALTVFCALSPARSDESYAILAGQSERGALEFRIFTNFDRNYLQIVKQNTVDALKGDRPVATDRLNLVHCSIDF